ncbi:SigE family RNA polymerase sigma factor [Actinophytocola oryzae]|uniref:RNA polymerase sigma-70 factor (Sigma-E family) n=1 Tax=Actinophytocola oryzae TaxID=502181 RepID=A0A4R7UVT0_9PSEU|nr:SigE family RNA polymerase sigma factor [Actinophytocola oryzae]TDV40137.1 RNA polymerase sigma-70 factor (sigma-E family) [Actinophytocola oryzae]
MRMFASFDEFVEDRSTALLRTAFLLTGDRGHAEDLLQTSLLRTLQRWAKARVAPEAYARRVLVNLSKDRLRARSRRPPEAELPPDVTGLPAVDAGYDRVTDRRVVLEALAELPPRQRQVVVLRFVEDLSVEQTADLLRCSEGTVKSQTSRALTRLRELLADFHGPQNEKETTDVRR